MVRFLLSLRPLSNKLRLLSISEAGCCLKLQVVGVNQLLMHQGVLQGERFRDCSNWATVAGQCY